MTNQEAIKTIKSNYPPSNYTMLRDGLDLAIQALKKQIPEKPAYARYFYCPCCTSRVGGRDQSGVYGKNYCSICGQEIDWTEWED